MYMSLLALKFPELGLIVDCICFRSSWYAYQTPEELHETTLYWFNICIEKVSVSPGRTPELDISWKPCTKPLLVNVKWAP